MQKVMGAVRRRQSSRGGDSTAPCRAKMPSSRCAGKDGQTTCGGAPHKVEARLRRGSRLTDEPPSRAPGLIGSAGAETPESHHPARNQGKIAGLEGARPASRDCGLLTPFPDTDVEVYPLNVGFATVKHGVPRNQPGCFSHRSEGAAATGIAGNDRNRGAGGWGESNTWCGQSSRKGLSGLSAPASGGRLRPRGCRSANATRHQRAGRWAPRRCLLRPRPAPALRFPLLPRIRRRLLRPG